MQDVSERNGASHDGGDDGLAQARDRSADSRVAIEERCAVVNGVVDLAKRGDYYFFHPEYERAEGSKLWMDGREMLDTGSYAYLGLSDHPRVLQAVRDAIELLGCGTKGSRLLSGTTKFHVELERNLADFFGSESCQVYSNGYATNVSLIAALMTAGDTIISDRYNHASIAAGAQLSGATVLTYNHLDMVELEERLREATGTTTMVVADAVFSMEGTILPLPEVVDLCQRYGAFLVVDEAHSFGTLGATGRGLAEHFGMDPSCIDLRVGTLSKFVPSSGGFVLGSEKVINALRHVAGSYIFTAALTPAPVAAALEGLKILIEEPERPLELQRKSNYVRDRLRAGGLRVLGDGSPIIPVVFPRMDVAAEIVKRLLEAGVFVVVAAYPAVPRSSPRIRLSICTSMSDEDLEFLCNTLIDITTEVIALDPIDLRYHTIQTL